MLQDLDRELACKDSVLPGLAALLDSKLLFARLRNLPQFAGLRTLTIDYLRYKPATSCVATLVLQMADGNRCYLCAKALSTERFPLSWQHPKRQRLVIRQDPFAPVALHELAIILSYPQHDRELPHLRLLNATPERDALLRRWLPETGEAALDIKILRYKPERRLLALLSRNGQPFATLRFASAGRYEAMLAGNQLGQALGEISLLAALPDYRLLITRWIEGKTLCPEQGGELSERDVLQTGRRLASVHSRPALIPATASSGIAEARRVFNTLRAVAPQQEALFISLLKTLENRLANNVFTATPIHGDFTLDQVVRRTVDGQLRLIDWDRARTGNPAVDLATFQARLELQAIEKTLSQPQASAAVAALHAGYRQQRGDLPPCLAAQVALALMQLAVEPFRKRAGNWAQQLAALLWRAEQLLTEEARQAARPDVALLPLLDKTRIAEPLRQVLGLPPSAVLASAAILACKPGRRAMLEYRWDTAQGELTTIGKYRHKGFNPHGFTVQQALWRDGFNGTGELIVPQPLAALAEEKLWLQQRVAGKRVTDCLTADGGRLAETGYLAGRALVKLQHSLSARQAVAGKTWTIADELAMLRQRLAQAAAARPAWATRINNVGKGCERLAGSFSEATSLFLHRDFYPAQLLLVEGNPARLAVLDFDLAAAGPAALDAGNYVAHVREQALRSYGDDKALILHEDAFLTVWLADAEVGDIANISLFTTLALARHIAISLLFPERHHTTEALITLCEARLALLARGAR